LRLDRETASTRVPVLPIRVAGLGRDRGAKG
jgi:hypothetical protein